MVHSHLWSRASLALVSLAPTIVACREESFELLWRNPLTFSTTDEALIGDRLLEAD